MHVAYLVLLPHAEDSSSFSTGIDGYPLTALLTVIAWLKRISYFRQGTLQ